MNRLRIIRAFSAALLLFAACQPQPQISITPESYDAPAAGGTVEFPVTANYEWTATSDADWVRVTADVTNGKLKVNVSQNSQPDGRDAVVKLTCKDLVKSFPIRQAQKDMVVVKDGTATVSWEPQTFDIPLQTNVEFSVKIEQEGDWLSFVSTKGLVSKTLTLSVAENPLSSIREARVILSGPDGALKVLTVSQSGHPQIFSVVHNRSTFAAPVLFGFSMTATISWGDGTSGNYNSTATHTYAKEGEHEVRVEASGAETASLSDLVGVLKVDLSGF